MSKKNDILYKSFTITPTYIYKIEKKNKEKSLTLVNTQEVLSQLRDDVDFITQQVENTFIAEDHHLITYFEYYKYEKEQEWVYKEILKGNDPEEKKFNFTTPYNSTGRELEFFIDQNILNEYLSNHGSSGKSRYQFLYQDRLFREVSSWSERVHAVNKTTNKHVSQGWERTARSFKPKGIKPKISLSSVDNQYFKFINNPLEDKSNDLIVELVIKGQWYQLHFNFNTQRFKDGIKINRPDITLDNNNNPRFHFTVEYAYTYGDISSRYITAVDVGIKEYATVIVWDTQNKSIVHSSILSRRIHSLRNSIQRTDKQKIGLINLGRYEEAAEHRNANNHKKKTLAILAAQEIADIAYSWDNSIIVVEDLSFVKNTMQYGRWNRGELIKWIKHYAELNGSRMFKVNPKNTSQECHVCHSKVTHPVWKESYCNEHGAMDRDVNASANIAQKFESSLLKVIVSRKKAKKYKKGVSKKRSPCVRNTLKYPGNMINAKRNTITKHKKSKSDYRYKRISKTHVLPSLELIRNGLDIKNSKEGVNNSECSLYHEDDGIVYKDDQDMIRTLEKQHDKIIDDYNNYSYL